MPFSYFCTCWNVSPNASANVCWVMPSIMRRMRMRLPTCTSIALGAFVLGLAMARIAHTRDLVHAVRPRGRPDRHGATKAVGTDHNAPGMRIAAGADHSMARKRNAPTACEVRSGHSHRGDAVGSCPTAAGLIADGYRRVNGPCQRLLPTPRSRPNATAHR